MTIGQIATLIVWPAAMLAILYGLNRAYVNWLGRSRPWDIPMIKARLEENEHRVVDIRRDGYIEPTRYRLGYRVYRAVVHSPLGGPDRVRSMGVWATTFGARSVVDLEKPHA